MSDQPLRILIIDDDEALCSLVQRSLARAGYEVTIANTVLKGAEHVLKGGFDAIILDHNLREQSGLELLEELRRQPNVPPVIFLTGSDEVSIAVAALKAGAADYVIKDVNGEFMALLDAAIEAAVKSARLLREKEEMENEVRVARDKFKKLAEERELMLKEINHRISNSLQLIAAVLHIQADISASEEVKKALKEANSRVVAVSNVHRSLYSSFVVGWVSLNDHLTAVVQDVRKMMSSQDNDGCVINFKTVSIQSTPDVAVAVGIVMTELILNALKHAYDGAAGEVRVTLSATPSVVRLTVEDDGRLVEHRTQEKSGTGLGKRIIARKVEKLKGSIDYALSARGMTAVLEFPVNEAVRLGQASETQGLQNLLSAGMEQTSA